MRFTKRVTVRSLHCGDSNRVQAPHRKTTPMSNPSEHPTHHPHPQPQGAPPLNSSQAQFWDERYASLPWAYGQEPNDFLRQEVDALRTTWGHFKGRRALCLADGEGRNGVYLAQLGFEVTSLDFSAQARKKALQWAQTCGVALQYTLMDLNDYDFNSNDSLALEAVGKSWDLIVAIFFQPSKPTRERLYAGLNQALSAQGHFILETKHERSSPESERYPGLATLVRDIEPLLLVTGQECARELNEGTYHLGMHEVTQLHAKKMA